MNEMDLITKIENMEREIAELRNRIAVLEDTPRSTPAPYPVLPEPFPATPLPIGPFPWAPFDPNPQDWRDGFSITSDGFIDIDMQGRGENERNRRRSSLDIETR